MRDSDFIETKFIFQFQELHHQQLKQSNITYKILI